MFIRTRLLQVAACGAVVFATTLAFGQPAGQRSEFTERFTANLESDGLIVSESAVDLLDPASSRCAGIIPTALYFNKAAPEYLIVCGPHNVARKQILNDRISRFSPRD